jgi:hypothetical protein
MPAPHVSTNFPDVLDPTFQRIYDEEYRQLPDMIPTLFEVVPMGARGDATKWSSVGTLPNWTLFTGSVEYSSQSQGYDVTATHLEYTNGVQVERKLYDDDKHGIINQKPAAMAASASRTRQRDAAKIFNRAFTNDTEFYNNTEAVALCSNSHTNTSGASTANGYDNLGTAALSATAVAAADIAANDFRDDQAELFDVSMDELWYPSNLYEEAFEIIASGGKVDTDLNNANVHQGRYKGIRWNRMTDTNNWFLADSAMRRRSLKWVDRVAQEFAMIEDFDTIIGKWRGYMRYSFAWCDWRWVYGSNVS